MSLIQEALRRQQEENQGGSPDQQPSDSTKKPEPFPYPVSIDEGNVSIPLGDASKQETSPKPRRTPVRITTAVPAAAKEPPAASKIGLASKKPAAVPPIASVPKYASKPEPSSTQAEKTLESTPQQPAKKKKSEPKTNKTKQKSSKNAFILAAAVILLLFGGAFYVWYADIPMPWQPPPQEVMPESTARQLAHKQQPADKKDEPAGNAGKANSAVTSSDAETHKMETGKKAELTDTPEKNKSVADIPHAKPADKPEKAESKPEKVTVKPAVDIKPAAAAKPPVQEKPITSVVHKPKQASMSKTATPSTSKSPHAIIWPEAKITGIVGSGARGAVMLNSSIVGIGETCNGITVVEVARGGAWLKYKGEKKFMKVGRSSK